jgi:ribosomal protein S18 acetylase RimI-like enzyme
VRLSDDIKIRTARSQDAVEIARIHVEAWRDAYAALLPPEYLARLDPRIEAARWNRASVSRLENTLVADCDGEVAGYAIIGPARGQQVQPAGEIYALYVETDWREQGIGRALVDAAFDRFRKQHLSKAVIWCLEGNFAARGFYQRCGGRLLPYSKVEEIAGMTLAVLGYGWEL